MAPEDEPSFEVRLEACLLNEPVEEVADLLRQGDGDSVSSATAMESALKRFESGNIDDWLVAILADVKNPKVLARCLYEFEQRDPERGTDALRKLEEATGWSRDISDQYNEALRFLAQLRENGEGGSDGGTGDREPLVPHDPRHGGAVALEPPREEDVDADTLAQGAEELIDTVRRMPM